VLLSLSPTVAQPSKSLNIIDLVSYPINLGAPTFSNRWPKGGEAITDLKIGHYKPKRQHRRWSTGTSHFSSVAKLAAERGSRDTGCESPGTAHLVF